MIILSGVLVVVAIGLLIAGIVSGNSGTEVAGLDGLNLIYISIGVSIVSALFLAIGVFLRRKDLFGSPATNAAGAGAARTAKRGRADRRSRGGKTDPAGDAATQAATGATTTSGGTGGISVHTAGGHTPGSDMDTAELAAMMPPPGDVPATAVVYVVPGRRRYHIDSCRQLAGRSKEELTFEEAREEGFSPCTACMPDTALAARAATGDVVTMDRRETADETAEHGESAASAATSEDEWGSVSRGRHAASPAGANGSLSPVTPVQRQALDDLAEDDEEPAGLGRPVADPATRPIGLAGEGYGAESAAAADDEVEGDDGDGDGTGDEDDVADRDAAAEEPLESSGGSAAESAAAQEPAARAEPDEPDEPDESASAEGTVADVPPQASHAAAATAPTTRPDEEGDSGGDRSLVRILSGTKRYHRPDCALIEDIGDDADDLESLSRAEAKARGCTPCLVCQPDKEPVRD